jgi:methylated-DNA-[protein]-cysteine S-methyltransferase
MFFTTFNLAGINFAVTATDKGIASIALNSPDDVPAGYKKLGKQAKEFFGVYDQLKEYFAGTRTKFTTPLHIESGTKFQKSVWKQLEKIPHGKTISYKDLAEKVGSPAGSANGKNPIPIIIPCHRVINHDRGLGGYSCGLDVKRKLLRLEKISWKE